MSHEQQRAFFELAIRSIPQVAEAQSVLEIGSYDVNGSVRPLFTNATKYVGVDLASGPGVDVVSYGHKVGLPDHSFDVAISGECFEHDPHWAATLENMVRLTRPGGIVLFTCATLGRLEHGTVRTEPLASPGTQNVGVDYYRNLTESDFHECLPMSGMFVSHRFWLNRAAADLYFVGQVAGGPASVDLNFSIDRIARPVSRADYAKKRIMRTLDARLNPQTARTLNLRLDPLFETFVDHTRRTARRLMIRI